MYALRQAVYCIHIRTCSLRMRSASSVPFFGPDAWVVSRGLDLVADQAKRIERLLREQQRNTE